MNEEDFDADDIAALNEVAKQFLEFATDKKSVPGWFLMSGMGVEQIAVGGAEIPIIPKHKTGTLIALAREDAYAFDLTCYIAARNIAALSVEGIERNQPLTIFAVEVLSGEIERPALKGRPRQSPLLAIFQYSLCKFVAAHSPLKLTRNTDSLQHVSSACDAVAQAFSKAGKHTTFAQMKSLCYDSAFQDIRDLAEYIGLLDYSEVPD